eukprot:scaffold2504_cov94-Cylindrotheca_fusiformis.AAC.1
MDRIRHPGSSLRCVHYELAANANELWVESDLSVTHNNSLYFLGGNTLQKPRIFLEVALYILFIGHL